MLAALEKSFGVAACRTAVAAHEGHACHRAGGLELFEGKAFGEANVHMINLNQLARLFGLHPVLPALGVVFAPLRLTNALRVTTARLQSRYPVVDSALTSGNK